MVAHSVKTRHDLDSPLKLKTSGGFPPQQVIQENKLPFQESDAGSKGNIFTKRSAKISKLHETKQKHR